jgi:putative hydrolase of the HAD superfamily
MFDLGGVIVAHDNAMLFRRLAQSCAAQDALPLMAQAAGDPRYGAGTLPIAHLHERLRQEAGYDGDWAQFVADWTCHFAVDFSMLGFVERLAARHRLVLFSNTNKEHWDYLLQATDGRLARLDAYLSHELGLLKPAPEAFQAVVARAGLTAGTTLFVDDLQANVDGAIRAGLQGLRFTDEAALRRALGM